MCPVLQYLRNVFEHIPLALGNFPSYVSLPFLRSIYHKFIIDRYFVEQQRSAVIDQRSFLIPIYPIRVMLTNFTSKMIAMILMKSDAVKVGVHNF
jgi:hypothetical protein